MPDSIIIGAPPDDPTCTLHGILYVPDPIAYPGPRPSLVDSHAGGFENGGLDTLDPINVWLAQNGWLCLSMETRLMDSGKLPGQVTDGKYNLQQQDLVIGIRYLRALELCDGFVADLGGSGSAHNAFWRALLGTVGDDRVDCAVLLSPVTNYANRVDSSPGFIATTIEYNRGETDLDILLSRSPVSAIDSNMASVIHFNGNDEAMPLGQQDDAKAIAASLGFSLAQYTPITNTGTLGMMHSFAMWNPPTVTGVRDRALQFLNDTRAAWTPSGGGGGPPPPTATREFVTLSITGLDPSKFLTLSVNATDKVTGLSGPTTPYEFVSDKDTGGGGLSTPPEGNYVLVPAPGGIPPDLSTKPYLDFGYVDGLRLRTQMNVVNGTYKRYDWTVVGNFLALCSAHNKLGAVSIAGGIFSPAYIYQRGAVGYTLVSGGTIPLPWDATYLALYKNLIKSFATTFNSSLDLRYIVLAGFGQDVGTFVCGSEDYNALNALAVAAGFANLAAGFTFGAQTLINYWVKACNTISCVLQLDYPVPTTQGGLSTVTDLVDWTDGTFGSRFGGYMTAKLTGATDGTEGLDSLLHAESRQQQVGYQFAYPASNPLCDPTQDPLSYAPEMGLRNTANAGIVIGAAWEEYQESDVLITDEPYPDDFVTFQLALKANSHV